MDTQTTHIYLASPNSQTAEIYKDATPEQKYILQMNERLEKEVCKLRTELAEKVTQIEELEESSDRDEKSKTYMRGLLVNYMEQVDTHKTIQKHQNELIEIAKNDYIQIREQTRLLLICAQTLIVLFAYLNYPLVVFTFSSFTTFAIMSFRSANKTSPHKSPETIEKTIKSLQKTTSEVDTAQEGLRRYLDEC